MFLESAFLWGIGAVSVPVIIHMMQSPRARQIDFPCIRFLKACQKRATRRTRLKNIILMLLRMAVIALIALGMAKPWREHEASAVLPDAPVSMVIVLDNSYSMGYADKGASRFEQARQAALGLVDTLKPGDEVALLLMNEEPVPALRELATDHERAKAALKAAELSVLGTNVDPTLREALRIVSQATASAASTEPEKDQAPADQKQRRRREIHILTDLQAQSWENVLKGNYLRTVETEATVYVTSFGRKGSPNCFIESATANSVGGEQVTITAQVRAVGAGTPGNVLTLNIDGRNVAQETFAVRPGAPASVPLTARLGQPGSHRCTLSLQDDALALDDRYFFTMDVGERSSVLVVDGDPSPVGALGETFYLGKALNPGGAFRGEGPSAIDARIISPVELPGVKLADYRTVLLCNVPYLDGADLVRLESFLREGGSLWVFLGDKVHAEQYNAWTFLPISLTQPAGDPSKQKSFGFGEVRGDHALFKSQIDMRSTRFFQCFGSARGSLKPSAVIIASFEGGQPALVEGHFGKGKTLLFTSTCDLAWNNFPLRRAFLPWVHLVIAYLGDKNTKAEAFRLKEKVTFQALAAHYKSTVAVTNPAGKRAVLPPQVHGGYAEATYAGTDAPGMYQVQADPAFSHHGGFGVNLDVAESVLTMADPERIAEAAPPGLLRFVDGPKRSIVEEVKKSREGEEFWPLLFKLALLFFIVESLFGNFVSRARKAGGMKKPLFEVLRQRNTGVAQ